MKIVLIGNYKPDKAYSMLKYAEMLERGLVARGYEATTVHPPVIAGRLPLPHGALAKWVGYIDKYVMAPLYLRWKARAADLVHVCDHSNSMYLRCAGNRPSLITCHDLLAVGAAFGKYPEGKTSRTGLLLQRWIRQRLAQAKYVVCVSQKTAADFRELIPNSRASVSVVHSSLNGDYFPDSRENIAKSIARLPLRADTPYLLHVGGNTWYKNRVGAIRIFAELTRSELFANTRLILAGHPVTPQVQECCEALGVEGRVIEATHVSDAELRALYSGAQALLFPSLHEGYGWPILEAQACGCPVITTGRPPMTEIAGDAAILIDPAQPAAAAEVIQMRWSELGDLRNRGFRNVAQFTDERMMAGYIAVYEELGSAQETRRPRYRPVDRS